MAIDFNYAMRELHKGNNKPMDELIREEQRKMFPEEFKGKKKKGKVIKFSTNKQVKNA